MAAAFSKETPGVPKGYDLNASKSGDKPEKVIPSLCEGYLVGETSKSYTAKDTILYALGVGASQNPLDEVDLQYTYENHENFSAIPTFGCVLPEFQPIFAALQECPGLPEFNPMMLLHGEHKLILPQPLPTACAVKQISKIKNVYDKKSGALVILRTETYDTANSTLLCANEASLFLRGIGGFGGQSSQPQDSKPVATPNRSPDYIFVKKTVPSQALIYRLSGDDNPLHVDPSMAALGGFDAPILHGLCSFGIAALGIVREACGGITQGVASIQARFSSPVVPGHSLQVEIWEDDADRLLFKVVNLDTGKSCVTNGVVDLRAPTPSKL